MFTPQRSNKYLIRVAILNGYAEENSDGLHLTQKGQGLVNALSQGVELGLDELELLCIVMDATLEALNHVDGA